MNYAWNGFQSNRGGKTQAIANQIARHIAAKKEEWLIKQVSRYFPPFVIRNIGNARVQAYLRRKAKSGKFLLVETVAGETTLTIDGVPVAKFVPNVRIITSKDHPTV